jgi:hypothetical protein
MGSAASNSSKPLVRVINGRRIEVPPDLQAELLAVEAFVARLAELNDPEQAPELFDDGKLGRCGDVVGAVYLSAEDQISGTAG